ncbi:PIN domain-containing protein [Microbacterium hominis]|uniref:PIN domain-containing protein n=1 Tax=Microbacterium hominis TaxID=162426 RepID=UPI0007688967|nr:PIN domain-containing protein [Microbacterium hominis]KXC04460.1 hypothetical protein MhomT_16230 [Microbacterium hominis]
MFLFIDANVIVGNPLLRGRQWDAVADAVIAGMLDLYVSELVVDEAAARYRDAASMRERAATRSLKEWPPAARELVTRAISASQVFSRDYEKHLRARLDQIGAEVIDYPQPDHRDIAARAIARSAPFDSDGNGYRDALLWLSFLDLLLTTEPEDPYAYFLSADKRAFGPQRQRQLFEEIDGLEVEWKVQILASIADFKVPGQFLDEEGALDAIQERQLHDAIEGALLAGGTPNDFTHVLAKRAGFDAADISEVLTLDVHAERVQVERKSREIWINYAAAATCLVKFESIEILDEDAGEYATDRDDAVWFLELNGDAYSSRARVDEVASLRLVSVEGDLASTR